MTQSSDANGCSQSSDHRLDRIETDLETIKDILLATARRAEAADERGIKLDQRLDRLTQNQEESQRQIDALREDVDIAFQTISLMAENNRTDMAFRAEMREMRLETRQIWEFCCGDHRTAAHPLNTLSNEPKFFFRKSAKFLTTET